MKRRTLSLALALSLVLAGCGGSGVTALEAGTAPPPVEAARDEALDTALGDFGLELLRQARREGENTVLSPLSVLFCLSMAANGAEGETAEQLRQALAGGGTVDALNGNCRSLLETYGALEDENTAEQYGITPGKSTLSIADSLWIDGRARVEDAFVGRCTDTYEAGIFAADFTRDGARKEINRWIEQHTGGHIRDALAEIAPETVLALVNAVYFEGKWAHEFDPGDTQKGRDFHLEDGSTAPVDYMCNGGWTELYLDGEDMEGVLLPYKDGRLAFLALMPRGGTTLDGCLAALDGAALQSLIQEAEGEYFTLYLPRFDAYWQGSLIEPLQAMGLTDAFDPAADFSGIGTGENGYPLYINALIHGAGIEVDEQGARAFAFTFGGMAGAGGPPAVLRFDRPFVYGIVDLDRGIPLFLGTFEQP